MQNCCYYNKPWLLLQQPRIMYTKFKQHYRQNSNNGLEIMFKSYKLYANLRTTLKLNESNNNIKLSTVKQSVIT